MIHTSYFAKLKSISGNGNLYPISIACTIPKGIADSGIPEYRKLCPPYDLLKAYKDGMCSEDMYIVNYQNNVLNRLNANKVVEELQAMCPEGMEPVLVCWEKSDKFCHRHIVSKWLCDNGFICKEIGGII